MLDVCFTPESGHVQCTRLCLLWANSGHVRCTRPRLLWAKSGHQRPLYSIAVTLRSRVLIAILISLVMVGTYYSSCPSMRKTSSSCGLIGRFNVSPVGRRRKNHLL